MDFAQIYQFLFQTRLGIAVLVGIGLLLAFVASIILEQRTKKRYKEHPKAVDEWELFEDEEYEEEEYEDEDYTDDYDDEEIEEDSKK